MLLPLLIGDQRRLVLLLLSLPQQRLRWFVWMLQRVLQPAYTRSISIEKDSKWNWNCRNPMPTFHSMFGHPANARSVVIQNRKPFSNLIGWIRRKEDRTDWIKQRKTKEIIKLCTNLMECIYEEPWHFWVVTEEVENYNSQGILSHWVWRGLADSMAVH